VRRLSLPTTAVAAAVGVLLLTASTAYFTFTSQSATSEMLAAAPPAATGRHRNAIAQQPLVLPAGYIPSQIPGEEILPADWEPPSTATAAEVPAQTVAREVPGLAEGTWLAQGGPATQPAAADSNPAAGNAARASVPVPGVANQATEIALAAFENSGQDAPLVSGDRPNANPNNTSLGGEIERTIATEIPTDKPEELLEDPDDRGFYDQWTVDNGDNSIIELVDELEETKPDLNSTELAEMFRKALDQPEDS
jgi:hypothetical protein